MKIRTKMLIIFLLLSIIPISIISLISIYSFHGMHEESIGINFSMLAREKANFIDSLLDERIAEVETIAAMQVVRDAVRRSNLKYTDKPEALIKSEILKEDRSWIDSRGKSALAKEIHKNRLSGILTDYQARNTDKYGEIFVTDIKGATVAMTKPLTDYYQADEQWWEASLDEGRGKVFLDHRGLDESIGALAVGMVVPIRERGEVIGIMKLNYKVSEILKVVSTVRAGESSEAFLLDTKGEVVAYSGAYPEQGATAKEKEQLKKTEAGWIEGSHHDGKIIFSAYAPLKSDLHTRIPTPGAIKGVSGERWELSKWYIFIRLQEDEAFAPISKVRQIILIIGVLTALAAIILAVMVSRAFSRPVENLTRGVRSIGEGKTFPEVNIESSDEIGLLSKAFNIMALNLKETTVSRDLLSKEVDERRQAEERLKESERYLSMAQGMAHIGHWQFDIRTQRVTGSDELYHIFGLDHHRDTMDSFMEIIHPDDRDRLTASLVKGIELSENWDMEYRLILKDGREKYAQVIVEVVADKDGDVNLLVGTLQDITERKENEEKIKRSLKEKEVLLKEVHHRVKNNLQVISSMLNLQKGHITDPDAIDVFKESQSRIMSMAMIHEMLYQSGDLSSVSLKAYLHNLTAKLFGTYRQDGSDIELEENIAPIKVEIDTAIQLGLITNELVSNALKYAFKDGREGKITVEFLTDGTGRNTFVLKDDGSGMPEGFDPARTKSLGLKIVELMVSQLDAQMEVRSENGTEFRIELPSGDIPGEDQYIDRE